MHRSIWTFTNADYVAGHILDWVEVGGIISPKNMEAQSLVTERQTSPISDSATHVVPAGPDSPLQELPVYDWVFLSSSRSGLRI